MRPPMLDDDELIATQHLAHVTLAELSRHDPSSSASASRADLQPLLRCFLLLLPFLDAGDLDLGACGHHILAFVRSILSRDPDPSFLPTLELIVQNLCVNDQLKSSVAMAADVIQGGSRVSTVAHSCDAELYVTLELMSHHFILSVQNEGGFQQFLSALSWSDMAMLGCSLEMGLPCAISLVERGYSISMPALVEAHFALLASKCVSNGDPDVHLLAFEIAMRAYLACLPALGVFDRTNALEIPTSCLSKRILLKSCIPETTYQKICYHINGLLSFCKLHCDDGVRIKESSIFDIFVCFIEENQHVIHQRFRQQAVHIIKTIVSNILGRAGHKDMHVLDAELPEEIICLAALVRLMGSSLLQFLHGIRQMGVADGWQNEDHLLTCKDYEFISETILLFGQYEANELHRHDLFGIIRKPVDNERASVLMLAHFASLLVCCLRMRFGFLWKGCIIMMMMAMNLVVAEDGSLDLFQSHDCSKDTAVIPVDQEGNLKGPVPRKSSSAIALQFNNIKKLHTRDKLRHDFLEDDSLGTLQRSESGGGRGGVESYFKSIPGYNPNSSEWTDLMDFIVCEPDVDYPIWWAQRKKFKKYKDKKWTGSKGISVNNNLKISNRWSMYPELINLSRRRSMPTPSLLICSAAAAALRRRRRAPGGAPVRPPPSAQHPTDSLHP